MNKIALVAKREFLTRVRKKTFILTTILLPLLMFGFYALIIYFSVSSDDNLNIAIADEANTLNGKVESKDNINFVLVKGETPESLKAKVEQKKYDGYIFIPKNFSVLSNDSLELKSGKSIGLLTRGRVEDRFNDLLEEKKLSSFNISKAQYDSVQQSSNLRFSALEGKEDSDAKAGISYAVGYFSGFLIYIILFIYGTMVMRGVMEEKVSRIAEVIVSSVKPFQLMMGKIVGIGAVGLVQFLIWVVLIIGLQFFLPLIFPGMAHAAPQPVQPGAFASVPAPQNDSAMANILQSLSEINFALIAGCFIFYFLGGYLLYSSLFAAVGSSVNEDPQDAQSLMLPITLPIIFGIVIMTKAVNEPMSGLAVFGSLFPLTSPIVMMARVSHGIPNGVSSWELLLSMALLVGGFLATTWVAAKIYRTGILLYGKKPTWKEMWKWAFRKS